MKTNSVLRKKLNRQVLSGWKQFLAIILIGGIAVTLFVGLLSNSQSLSERVESFYSMSNAPDIYVTTSRFEMADQDNIQTIIGKHDQIESRFQLTSLLEGRSSFGVITPEIPKMSKPISVKKINEVEEGSFFLIDEELYKKDKNAYDDGATITYDLSSLLSKSVSLKFSSFVKEGGENVLAKDQVKITYTVSGTMKYNENIAKSTYSSGAYLMGKKLFRDSIEKLLDDNYTEIGSAMIKTFLNFGIGDEYSYRNRFPQSNQYLIKLQDKADLDKIENRLNKYFDQKGKEDSNLYAISDRSTNPWSITIDNDVNQALQLTFVFPVVFFLVALLVILTTLSQIIIKERIQIGTFKAIGLTRKQIYLHYIKLTLTLVSIAIIVGSILGPIIIPSIMGAKYDILYSLPARSFFVFPWWQAALTAVVFLGLSALVTFLVCRKEINLLPAESMRAPIIAYKQKGNMKKGSKNRFMLAIKMAFRNIRSNLAKSIMVIIGVMGCTALLICGFGINDTLNYGVGKDLATFYTTDISMTYSSIMDSPKESLLSKYDEIERMEEYLNSVSSLSSVNKNGSINKTFSSSLYLFDDGYKSFKISIPTEGNSVGISNKVASELKLKKGDLIKFTFQGNTYLGKVGVIFEEFITHGVFGYFSDYPEIPHQYKNAWLDIKDGVNHGKLAKLLQQEDYISSAESRKQLEKTISDVMSGVSVMTNAVKVFAILLAAVVLYNLILLNFRERQRDIATLKVLGFSMVEIAASLIFEMMLLTLVGIGFGMLLGYPFMKLVLFVNRVALVEFLYHINPITYLIALAITGLVAIIVNIYMSFLTKKVKMVESLKSVE